MTAAAARPGDFDLAELSRSSALTGNPVPGLARALTRLVPDPAAKGAVHKGATSQDILDTAAMLLARDAIDAAADSLSGAAAAVARLADAHRGSLMIGRTLLQQAVPVTFGVVAAGWLAGLDGALDGLASARATRLAVQFGGAAGTLASLGSSGAAVKSLMAAELGLADPPLPVHTERLRVIDVAVAMARVTAALSKIARDVTLLAQTEIAEVSEGARPPGEELRGRAGAAPRPCPTRATWSPRSPSSAARGRPAACSRPSSPAPSRSTSARPAPGTPSGSRSATCSSSPSPPPPGRADPPPEAEKNAPEKKPEEEEEEEQPRARPLTIFFAIGVGLIATICLIGYIVWDQMNSFQGADRITELLNSANGLTGDEFEAVQTTTDSLKDWFLLKNEHFTVPKEFGSSRTIACRVFQFHNADVGQVMAKDDRELLYFLFDPADLGVQLKGGKWEIVEGERLVGGVTVVEGTCFVVAFRGKHDEMQTYLAKKVTSANQ